MRTTWLLGLVVVGLAGGSTALAKDPPPPDVKCGTPEWAPFREAVVAYCKKKSCQDIAKAFTTCKNPMFEDAELEPIKGTDLAKKRFTYSIGLGGDTRLIGFTKGKKAWSVGSMTSEGSGG